MKNPLLEPLESLLQADLAEQMQNEHGELYRLTRELVRQGVHPNSIYQTILYTTGNWSQATRIKSVAEKVRRDLKEE